MERPGFEDRLTSLRKGRIPRHIGVIPDGNRRWAVARGMEKREGYAHGIDPALDFLQRCLDLGVEEISVYGFTQENTRRPREQRLAYQAACLHGVERLSGLDADLLVVGESDSPMFPEGLKQFTRRTMLGQGGIKVNFLINYSWKWDLEQISRTGMLGSQEVSEIELVIRWGGRSRLSGFLPVQSAYADIYVLEDLWPDYRPDNLADALEWYQLQDVTKGG